MDRSGVNLAHTRKEQAPCDSTNRFRSRWKTTWFTPRTPPFVATQSALTKRMTKPFTPSHSYLRMACSRPRKPRASCGADSSSHMHTGASWDNHPAPACKTPGEHAHADTTPSHCAPREGCLRDFPGAGDREPDTHEYLLDPPARTDYALDSGGHEAFSRARCAHAERDGPCPLRPLLRDSRLAALHAGLGKAPVARLPCRDQESLPSGRAAPTRSDPSLESSRLFAR